MVNILIIDEHVELCGKINGVRNIVQDYQVDNIIDNNRKVKKIVLDMDGFINSNIQVDEVVKVDGNGNVDIDNVIPC